MVQSFTAFELEAERRREVLEASMRAARRARSEDRQLSEAVRGQHRRRADSLAALTAGLRAWVGQRT
jgi:hypothetical protein